MAYEFVDEAPKGRYEFVDDAPAPKGPKQSGFGRGLRDPIDGGAQLLTNLLPGGVVQAGNRLNNWIADTTGMVGRLPEGGVDQQVRESEKAYQAQRGPDAGMDWGRIGGNVLSPANLALASRLPVAATTAGRIGAGALGGAASAALNPVSGENSYAGDKLQQVGIGAAGGALVPAIAAGFGRMVSPAASRNPELQLLQREGVRPTIGQAMGGRWNATEEKLQSLPIMGDMITRARGRARDDFNQAALNRVTAPIGQRTTATGQEGVRQAGDLVTDAYTQARNQMGNFRLDRQGIGELQNIRQMADQLPDETGRRAFQRIWGTVAGDISPNGTIRSEVFKKIDSKLGAEAASFAGSPDAYQRQLGDAIGELQNSIRQNALRANPVAATATRAADTAYANLVRVEGAAKGAMQSGGMFTPGQLGSAVRQADRSVRDRATARGTALMQDLAGAGQSVLGNKVPNSATADRLMLGVGGLSSGMLNPAIPAALIGGAGLYTNPMQSLLTGALTARPQAAQAVRQSLLQASPGFVPAGAQIGLGLLDY